MMGGDVSHAYMAYAEAGEDEIVFCRACGYAANVELAVAGADRRAAAQRDGAAQRGGRPAGRRDQAHARGAHHRRGRRLPRSAGARLHEGARRGGRRGRRAGEPLMVLLRGDHELNELKLRNALGAEFRLATADEVLAAQGVEPGFVGPVPTDAAGVRRRGAGAAAATSAGANKQRPPPLRHQPRRRSRRPGGRHPRGARRRSLPELRRRARRARG